MKEKFTREEILKIKNVKFLFKKFKIVRLDNEDEGSFYDVYLIEGDLRLARLENIDGSFRNVLQGEKEKLDMTGFAEDVAFYLNNYFK